MPLSNFRLFHVFVHAVILQRPDVYAWKLYYPKIPVPKLHAPSQPKVDQSYHSPQSSHVSSICIAWIFIRPLKYCKKGVKIPAELTHLSRGHQNQTRSKDHPSYCCLRPHCRNWGLSWRSRAGGSQRRYPSRFCKWWLGRRRCQLLPRVGMGERHWPTLVPIKDQNIILQLWQQNVSQCYISREVAYKLCKSVAVLESVLNGVWIRGASTWNNPLNFVVELAITNQTL